MIGAKRKSFTLMEAVVVMGIFVILLTSMTEIFLRTSQFGRQIALRSKLQSDARYAVEAVARAVRVSDLDYASWGLGGGLPPQPNSELRLIDPTSGAVSRIRLDETDAGCWNDGSSFPCVAVSTDNFGSVWTPLTPQKVKVETLLFFASPPVDPFLLDEDTGLYASNSQPIVTVLLTVRGLSSRVADEWVYSVQTTVTPRLYLR